VTGEHDIPDALLLMRLRYWLIVHTVSISTSILLM